MQVPWLLRSTSSTDHSSITALSPNLEAVPESCQHSHPAALPTDQGWHTRKPICYPQPRLSTSGTGIRGKQGVPTWPGVTMALAAPTENSETALGEFSARESGAAVTGISPGQG